MFKKIKQLLCRHWLELIGTTEEHSVYMQCRKCGAYYIFIRRNGKVKKIKVTDIDTSKIRMY